MDCQTGRRTDGPTDGRTGGRWDGWTDGRTDGWTDTTSYRNATAHLKRLMNKKKTLLVFVLSLQLSGIADLVET